MDARVVRVVVVAALEEFTAVWFPKGTGVLTLICSTIFTKIEEGVMFVDWIASANEGVSTAKQFISFFVAEVAVRSALNSASDVTLIMSSIAGTTLADVCLNMGSSWNSIPIRH